MRFAVTRSPLSLAAAILSSLVIASPSLAASWSPAVTLASSAAAFTNGLLTLDNGTTLLAYVDCGDPQWCYSVRVRRSTDGGATWEPPTILSADGYFASIAGRGSRVDVTWTEGRRLKYARSRDSGVSFGRGRTLALTRGGETSVARGPGGIVAVTWTQSFRTGVIKSRVSVNGGSSFGPRQVVVGGSEVAGNPVAVGDGVIYVAYIHTDALWVKRSLDFGATWSSAILISDTMRAAWHQFSIDAAGEDAYVLYSSDDGSIIYRRTIDKGASWSTEVTIDGPSPSEASPDISIDQGVVRAVYNRAENIYYRESADGLAWTPAEKVTGIGFNAAVGFAGQAIVAYDIGVSDDMREVRVRTRAP